MKITSVFLSFLLVLSISASCAPDKPVPDKTGDERSFLAIIVEITNNTVVVEPLEGEEILSVADRISFSDENLDDINASVGDTVNILYLGEILTSYPAQVNAVSWTAEFYK